MRNNYLLILLSTLLLGIVVSPSAFAQKELVRYKLVKTVYDNGKVVDRSKENITRYYVYYNWGTKPESEHTWMAVANAEGTELFNTTNFSIEPKKKVQSMLRLIDNAYAEYYPFVYKRQTNSGIALFLPNQEGQGMDQGMEIRVTIDKVALNYRYRKNKIKNTYVIDVYERINEKDSSDFIR